MKYILLLFATLMNLSIFAQTPNIVAIVNDTPITLQDFNDRLRFLYFINNVQDDSHETSLQISRVAMKTLIDEQLFIDEAKRLKIVPSKSDIAEKIRYIEKDSNMPAGSFIAKLKEQHINVESLYNQLRAQLIKEHIAYRFSHSINISKDEIDEAAVLANKEILYQFKKFSINGKQALTELTKLRNKITSCQIDLKYNEQLIKAEHISISLNRPTILTKLDLQNFKPGQVTDITQEQDNYSFYILCTKKVANMQDADYDYITNVLTNKKVATKIHQHYERIKRKAFIKLTNSK